MLTKNECDILDTFVILIKPFMQLASEKVYLQSNRKKSEGDFGYRLEWYT